jgi:ribulose-phosphate 3-epimerase
MAKLSPSILSADFTCLGDQLRALEEGGADYLHFDVMDGAFVPNISFGGPVLKSLAGKTSLPFDVHLMIERPDDRIPDFVTPQTEIITVHYEACRHIHRTIQLIKSFGIKAGAALNPGTPAELLEPVFEDLDFVLVMSVNPGFGGQKFIESSYRKIVRLCEMRSALNPSLVLGLDGGVTLNNAAAIAAAGIDVLDAGSSVFGAPDIAARVREFKAILA